MTRSSLLHRRHATGGRHDRSAPTPRRPVQARRSQHLAHPRRRVDHYRPPLRHRQGLGLARAAPTTRLPGTLGRARHPAHRGRHPDPGRGRTPAQTHQRDQEDPVAVGRQTRLQPRHLLAGLPAPLRHRTPLLSSSRTPSAGPPPRCAPPNKPTAGPGSSSPPTPSSASPETSSTTSASHGNDNANPADAPPPPSEEGVDDLPQHWAPQPVHQNPEPPAQDAPKEPAESDEPAIQRSRRPPHQGLIASLGDRTSLLRRLARAEGLGPARKVAAPTLPPRPQRF